MSIPLWDVLEIICLQNFPSKHTGCTVAIFIDDWWCSIFHFSCVFSDSKCQQINQYKKKTYTDITCQSNVDAWPVDVKEICFTDLLILVKWQIALDCSRTCTAFLELDASSLKLLQEPNHLQLCGHPVDLCNLWWTQLWWSACEDACFYNQNDFKNVACMTALSWVGLACIGLQPEKREASGVWQKTGGPSSWRKQGNKSVNGI